MRSFPQRLVLLATLAFSAIIPAMAQAPGPLKPIAKAGLWMLADDLPPARGCAAMLHDDEVDVNLLEGNDGQMVLVASSPDWKFNPGPLKFRFQVDKSADQPMDGDLLANLLVMSVDAKLQAALFSAKEVTWKVPGAEFHAHVVGLKTAFAALKACNIRKGVAR